MVNPYREEAREANDQKLRRMGVQVRTADEYDDRGIGHTGPAADGSMGKAHGGYADKYQTKDGMSKATMPDLEPPTGLGTKQRVRLDRKQFASGGRVKKGAGTVVNIVVGKPTPQPVPVPVPAPPMAGPPPMPPQGMPSGPQMGAMPPGLGRKAGGRVSYPKMKFGAGGGEGREEKVRKYGKRAYEGAANKSG